MDKLLWKDYFDSLGDAINRLQEVLDHPNIEESDIIRDAAIQRFEFAIEMFLEKYFGNFYPTKNRSLNSKRCIEE